jgi:hypothetical protein
MYHHVILSVAKNLAVWLRINSVKNLMESMYYKVEILRLEPQNDIATQPPDGEELDFVQFFFDNAL